MLTLEELRVTLDGFTLTADLTLREGARVAVLGPSGAGKSTLLAAIAGFLPLDSGRITWRGVDLSGLPPARRPVSILFQDGNLFPHLTVRQNVGLGLKPNLRLTPDEAARVEAALGRVGLEGYGNRRPGRLSGGQAARVALARVLLMDRPIVLLDEPFGALGPALRAEMLNLVKTLVADSGATILTVSHEPDDATALAEEVILVAGGTVHPPVPVADIFADPPDALREYLGRG